MNEIFVLDACALIAFLNNEHGADKVILLFKKAAYHAIKTVLHKATLLEVYYDALRRSGPEEADAVLTGLSDLPIVLVDNISDSLLQAAAYFKTTYKVSFADCFVLALAKVENAEIVTSDHHEFNPIEKAGDLRFHWIR